MVRRLTKCCIGVLILVLAAVGHAAAQSGTPKPKSSLSTEINSSLPDNTVGLITPAGVRALNQDFLASWQQAPQIRLVSGTTDTITASDYGQVIRYNSTNPVAVTIASATSLVPFNVYVQNSGAGAVTITPTGSTINGLATLVLPLGAYAWIVSDGSNYQLSALGASGGCGAGGFLISNGSSFQCSLSTGNAATINPTPNLWLQGLRINQSVVTASTPPNGIIALNYINGTINAPNAQTTVTNGLTDGFTSLFRVDAFSGGANIGPTTAGSIFTHTVSIAGGPASSGFDGTLHILNIKQSYPSAGAHGSDSIAIIDVNGAVLQFGGIELGRVICDGSGVGGGGAVNGSFCQNTGTAGTANFAYGGTSIAAGQKNAVGWDAAYAASNNGTAGAAFKELFMLSGYGGLFPITSTGSLFQSDVVATVANVFNFSGACGAIGSNTPCNLTITGDFALFPNFRITGGGQAVFGSNGAPVANVWVQGTCTSCGVAALLANPDGVSGVNGLQTKSSTLNNSYTLYANEASRAGTFLGVNVANTVSLSSDGASHAGLLIGTSVNAGFALGTNNTSRITIAGGGNVNVGNQSNASAVADALLTINANTGLTVAPPAGTILHVIGPDSSGTTGLYDSYAAQAGVFGRRADTTRGAPSAILANERIVAYLGIGYGATGYIAAGATGGIGISANQNFTDTAAGTFVDIFTTPNGSTTVAATVRAHASGALSVGTTATDPGTSGVVNVSTGFRIANAATTGNVLRGNGTNFVSATLAPSDLSPGAVARVKIQKFTASGTYTPTAGILYAIIECVGSGGGGGGVTGDNTGGHTYAGGGGGAGGYSRAYVSAATIGASQTVTVNAAGTGSAGANGGNGGSVSVGALCIANGGNGGTKSDSGTLNNAGGVGGTPGTGDVVAAGMPGQGGMFESLASSVTVGSGMGGNSYFGGAGVGVGVTGGSAVAGVAAGNYGSGGSGAIVNGVTAGTAAGGNGSTGIVVVSEFTNS